jgi:two-component system sensor histidine kinase/response regulator
MSNITLPPATEPGARPPLKILLAEDNVTNQKLAVALLKKQGNDITVAGDGRQAVEHFERENFDLVLMDMQMPELDGLEATAAIRKLEQRTGTHVPIIAVTANAMIGDREQCLKAGMDDYLSKPLRADDLFAMIRRLTSQPRPSATPAAAADPSAGLTNDVFDYAASVQQLGDDAELLSQLVAVFLEQLPQLLRPLAAAVASADAGAIRQTAHALTSSVSVISASRAKSLARKLELMGLNSDLAGVELTHAELLREISLLRQAFDSTPSFKAA